MRIIEPSIEIWEQPSGIEGMFSHMERAGRLSYLSEPKEDKAEVFIQRLINKGHTSVLEHGTVYLQVPVYSSINEVINGVLVTKRYVWESYINNKYSKVVALPDYKSDNTYYITTNYRVIIENGWLEDLKYMVEPSKHHAKRLSVVFETQIAVSREGNRHRSNSIVESSTRYVNFSQDKFDNQIGINIPKWVSDEEKRLKDNITGFRFPTFEELKIEYFSVSDQGITKDDWSDIDWWIWSNYIAEESYMNLLKLGKTPQEARVVLPLDTNTKLIHTAFIEDWKHFFNLRSIGTTGPPHPDMKVVADMIMDEFKERKLI